MSMTESNYLDLLRDLLQRKHKIRTDRTGTGTVSVFGRQLCFDLTEGKVPAVTTKRLAWRACLEELLWFLRGSTDASELTSQIWEKNSTRSFLDSRGLGHLPDGDIGAGYGFQWRHFGAQYHTCKDDYSGQGFDQIKYVEDLIRTEPTSRRIFMTAWNPSALDKMALPPCHVSAQFYVDDGTISCHLVMRSADCFLGLPFNLFSYSVLTHLLAKRHALTAQKLVVSIGDAHLYKDHIEAAETQVNRDPMPPPTLKIADRVTTLQDLDQLDQEDFDLCDYAHHPAIRANMSA